MSRSSDIWQYFDVSAVDVTRVNCKLCNASLSHGRTGKKASFNTSRPNLQKHLRCTHDEGPVDSSIHAALKLHSPQVVAWK